MHAQYLFVLVKNCFALIGAVLLMENTDSLNDAPAGHVLGHGSVIDKITVSRCSKIRGMLECRARTLSHNVIV